MTQLSERDEIIERPDHDKAALRVRYAAQQAGGRADEQHEQQRREAQPERGKCPARERAAAEERKSEKQPEVEQALPQLT